MELDKKALNLEMLRIAGFTCTGGIWTYPDGVDVDNGVPFFPDDFNACLEWIVPKLNKWGYDLHLNQTGREKLWFFRIDRIDGFFSSPPTETPALAFCLAVKELINDKE